MKQQKLRNKSKVTRCLSKCTFSKTTSNSVFCFLKSSLTPFFRAETVAEKLVAKIILEAIKESAHRLSMLNVTSESEDEDSVLVEQSKTGLEPGFVNSNETIYCMENENIIINARLTAQLDNVPIQWFKEGQELSKEQ